MTTAIHRSLVAVVSLSIIAVAGSAPADAAEIRVFAAASLTDVLQVIARRFEAQSGDRITFNFAGSNVLARQILEGAPADIFISADEAEMTAVANSGLLVESSRHDLLSNSLVIIVPQQSEAQVTTPSDLLKPAFRRIALGDPEMVPAGVYAKAWLEKQGIWDAVRSKVIPAANVRAALAAVASGDADAGIVYKTDALIGKGTKVACEIPAAEGPKILYPVSLVKNSHESMEAGKFLEYLRSSDASKLFSQYGFVTAE